MSYSTKNLRFTRGGSSYACHVLGSDYVRVWIDKRICWKLTDRKYK
jgi:hypothetical protein